MMHWAFVINITEKLLISGRNPRQNLISGCDAEMRCELVHSAQSVSSYLVDSRFYAKNSGTVFNFANFD